MIPTKKKQPSFNRDISKFENGIHSSLGQDSFNFITLKGQGAFGKVYKVSNFLKPHFPIDRV